MCGSGVEVGVMVWCVAIGRCVMAIGRCVMAIGKCVAVLVLVQIWLLAGREMSVVVSRLSSGVSGVWGCVAGSDVGMGGWLVAGHRVSVSKYWVLCYS